MQTTRRGTNNIAAADFAFVGGGTGNMIGDAATTFSGSYGVIGGGANNWIDASAADALHNFIGGGVDNTIAVNCSAILGGCNNLVNGHDWAGVFGCNVTTNQHCAFHANNFVAQNMPLSGGGYPSGKLYYCVVAPGFCPVFIV